MKSVVFVMVVLLMTFVVFGGKILPADLTIAGVNLSSAALDTKASLGTVSAKAAQGVLTKDDEYNTAPGWLPPPRPQGSLALRPPTGNSNAGEQQVLAVPTGAVAPTIPPLEFLPTPSPSQVASGVLPNQNNFLGIFGVWSEADLNLVAKIGASWIRVPISLEKIEDIAGQSTLFYDEIFTKAQEKGIQVLLVLHIRQPASDIALESLTAFLMERYGGYTSFAAIQPGNEPDHYETGFTGTVEQYWRFHLAVSRVAKRYRKDMLVVVAGLSASPGDTARPYFEDELLPYLARDRSTYDAVGVHEYGSTMLGKRIAWYQAGLARVSYPGDPPPIWVTEFGIPNATEQSQAEGLVSGLEAARSAGVGKVFVFQLQEDPYRYGLLNESGQPKQAFWALKNWNNQK